MKLRPVTWQPLLVAPGRPVGIALHRPFALACMEVAMTAELQERIFTRVWDRVKPADWTQSYIPSNILHFDRGTLLVTMVQRYSDHGKWLDCGVRWHTDPDEVEPLIYSYHHAQDQSDANANLWLEYTFSHWVQFAHIVLQEQGSEYLEVL